MAIINKRYTLIDMHSHILPVGGVDDGSKSMEETVQLLRQTSEQHIDTLVFTPHYYHTESIRDFVIRRNKARKQLEAICPLLEQHLRMPAFYYGAEVLFQPRMSLWEDLPLLCIEGTEWLLLELPFELWGDSVFEEIERMILNRGIRIIIAHLERYLKLESRKNLKRLEALQGQNLLIQMNGAYILENPRNAKKRIQKGLVDLLGSDAHHPDSRPQDLGKAVTVLEQWDMQETIKRISQNSMYVLNQL